MLKITAGQMRGRKLKGFKNAKIRPTASMLREAIFNIFHDEVAGSTWWDLCAGTGIIGFEALSRGARHVTFVDRSRGAVDLIRQNTEILNLREQIQTHCSLASQFLKKHQGAVPDFIYFDPPYDSKIYAETLTLLDEKIAQAPKACYLLIEHRKSQILPESLAHWQHLRTRPYGDTSLSIYASGPGQ